MNQISNNIINYVFYRSISFYYKTITRVTVKRCRYDLNTFRISFEFSHSLPQERQSLKDLNDPNYFLLYTAEREISLYVGQRLQFRCFNGDMPIYFLTLSQQTYSYEYTCDPWNSTTIFLHISLKYFKIKSSQLFLIYSDLNLNKNSPFNILEKFTVSI